MELISNKDYLLLIDPEIEILKNDYYIDELVHPLLLTIPLTYSGFQYESDKLNGTYKTPIMQSVEGTTSPRRYSSKVIAYYPLTKKTRELDLPVLPSPFKEEVDNSLINAKKFAVDKFQETFNKHKRGGKITNDTLKIVIETSVECGYKFANKTQTKQFTLEDIRKAIEFGVLMDKRMGEINKQISDYLGFLSNQQLPKEFIIEYQVIDQCNCECHVPGNWMMHIVPCCYPKKVIKTIINSESKQELVGTYKY